MIVAYTIAIGKVIKALTAEKSWFTLEISGKELVETRTGRMKMQWTDKTLKAVLSENSDEPGKVAANVLAGQIRTGEWLDWKRLYALAIRLAEAVFRQRTPESIMSGVLVMTLLRSFWLQTRESDNSRSPRRNRQHGPAWQALNNMVTAFSSRSKPVLKQQAKPQWEYDREMEIILLDLKDELLRLVNLFPQAQGLAETLAVCLRLCQKRSKRMLKSLAPLE